MKQTLRIFVPMILGCVLGAGMAIAADAKLASPPAPRPAVVAPAVGETPVAVPGLTAVATPAVEIGLFTPVPQPAAICPLIGCVNDDYCRRDRDCTAAPGGVCNLFCPTLGCCSYPSP
jgi:hypothetical protein